MVREIPLSKGFVALVDDDDFERVNRHKWSYVTGTGKSTGYARRVITVDGVQYNVLLHRFILGAPDGIEIDHCDRDGLNNQKSNLRFASRRQNNWNSEPKQIARRGKSWFLQFQSGDQKIKPTSFDTEEAATAVRDALIRKTRGEFGVTTLDVLDPWADQIADRLLAGESLAKRNSRTRAVISESDVVSIRALYHESNIPMRELGQRYGLKASAISHIVTGRTWKDVGGPRSHRRERDTTAYRTGNRARRKLADDQIVAIRERYAAGTSTQVQLAAEFGVAPSTVQHICQGRSFQNVGGPITGFRKAA
jgi:hypothetical protein